MNQRFKKISLNFTNGLTLNSDKLGKTEIPAIINIKNPNYDIYDKADDYLYSADRFIDEQEPSFETDIEEDENGNIKTVYKEVSKPKGKEFERSWYNSYKEDLINRNIDGIITDAIKVVFEPEQIHILSSKKDLEMFRNFINFTKSEYAKNNKTDFENFKNNFETTKCDE